MAWMHTSLSKPTVEFNHAEHTSHMALWTQLKVTMSPTPGIRLICKHGVGTNLSPLIEAPLPKLGSFEQRHDPGLGEEQGYARDIDRGWGYC